MKEKGFGNHAYILPEVERILKNYSPDMPIYITEGEKKAAKATLEGFPTIGLSGVSCSKDKENDFLPELEELVWKDRTVYIPFDSDIPQKYEVKHAEIRLAVTLINRGAKVYSVHLPNEENGNKNGLDDYLVRYRKEAFQELVREAKPTLELHIDVDIRTERLLEEIARIKSESEKNKWVKLISEKQGISQRAINKDLEQYKPKGEREAKAKKYTAYFPKLVDLVEDENGNVAFLVKEGKELIIKSSVVIDGEVFYAPTRDQLPFKFLPQAVEVLKHYTQDTDQKLFTDLIVYHNLVSELPNDRFYELIATWVLHTYLLEAFAYSPYIWLYAIPERGKSRTGKGAIQIAYRGVHVESLRDAYLIRMANNLKASIFFDVIDLWKKAEKAGSEDFLLHRFERGVFIARVNNPECGAFEDTTYYNIFGASIIATNEGIHQVLESRAISITMKAALKEFGDIPLDLARSLKERLVAFRARHLGKELPQCDKPAKSRLGDMLKPLMQVVLLVDPKREESFKELISELDQDRKAQKSESTEARLISIIAELESEVSEGLFSIQSILNRYNEGVDERYKTTNQRLGWRVRALGFTKRRQKEGVLIEFDHKLLEKLLVQFGLKEESKEPTGTPLEKLHHLHDLHPSNNDKGLSDVEVGVDSQQTQTSTSNLHLQNLLKYGTSANDVDGEDVSRGIEGRNNFSDYQIERITYSIGDVVYKLEKKGEDGKPLIRIITPDCSEFEDIRRQYEQQSR